MITTINPHKQLFSLRAHSQCAQNNQAQAAIHLLKGSGLSLLDAARLTLELIEATGSQRHDRARLHQAIQAGAQQLRLSERSVSFASALRSCLTAKAQRSPRTLRDINQTMSKLQQHSPELGECSIRSLDSAQCEEILKRSYGHSASRFIKARANLSGVFTHAERKGWCDKNPIRQIPIPKLQEREIRALSYPEIKKLLKTAQQPMHRACLPALGLMLYAGVRPEEVKRLSWGDIDWEERELIIAPRHSKTGGGRHIPLAAPLLQILSKSHRINREDKQSHSKFCPTQWEARWQHLRQSAGFSHWVPDVLRHSYASYHAKHYRDLPALQLSMGHRDIRLLLTRYVNLRGISRSDAKMFWAS